MSSGGSAYEREARYRVVFVGPSGSARTRWIRWRDSRGALVFAPARRTWPSHTILMAMGRDWCARAMTLPDEPVLSDVALTGTGVVQVSP